VVVAAISMVVVLVIGDITVAEIGHDRSVPFM
jgi:hypothetical protein